MFLGDIGVQTDTEEKEKILERLDNIEKQFNENTPQRDRTDLSRIRQMVITGDVRAKRRLLEESLRNASPELQSGVIFGVVDIRKELSDPASEKFYFMWLNIFLRDRFG